MFTGFKLYALIGICGLIAALAISNFVTYKLLQAERTKVDAITQQRDTARASIVALQQANESNVAATKSVKTELETCQTQNALVQHAADAARAHLVSITQARDAALAKLKSTQEAIYANNSQCSAWGAAAMCSDLSHQLRDQWEQVRQSGDQAGSGNDHPPSVRAHSTRTHLETVTAASPGDELDYYAIL